MNCPALGKPECTLCNGTGFVSVIEGGTHGPSKPPLVRMKCNCDGTITVAGNVLGWQALDAEASIRSETQQLNPKLLPALPGHKPLTFIMTPEEGEAEADALIAAMREGRTTFLPTPISGLFFHHLRLRVALEPALQDKIAVYYLTPERQWCEVGLRKEDELRWPVGFEQAAWNKEIEISAVRGAPATSRATEIAAALRRKYGC